MSLFQRRISHRSWSQRDLTVLKGRRRNPEQITRWDAGYSVLAEYHDQTPDWNIGG